VPTQSQRVVTTTITQPARTVAQIQLRTTTYTVSRTVLAPTITVVRAMIVTSVRTATATVTRQVVGAAGVGKTVTRVVTRTVSGGVFW
jgi:hypothetical protein